MPNAETVEVNLQLNTIEELFFVSEINPLNPHSRFISGIDELLFDLHKIRLRSNLKITINLPNSVFEPDLEERAKGALNRYCTAKIEENRAEIKELHRLGWRALASALIIIVVTMGLATLLTTLTLFNETTAYLISQGLVVFGWVTLWYPANVFLYDWRPYARAKVGYQRIQNAELIVESA